jgi:hypothetical protein
MPEAPWHGHIIKTPQGIYVPAEVADKLKPYAEPPGLYDPGLSLLATPIYVLPPRPPKKPARWWVRAWRRLTKWRRRDV